MIKHSSFGQSPDGQTVTLYTISNSNGMKASVTDYGAILVSLFVSDQRGVLKDVVLGFDSAEGYFDNPSFFGSTIGPNANRIAKAGFQLDGNICFLDANDGENNLHSHREQGYHKRMWEAQTAKDSVIFTLTDKDGSMGFPGSKEFQVIYTLDEENGLTITYHAKSDKRTVLNPTNHSYFNLEGHKTGTICDHELWLGASRYTPVRQGSIPTGEIASVENTPMDFMSSHPVGQLIDADFEQLVLTGGYDHNYVIDDWNGELRHFATVKAPVSGRVMKVFTTLPGVQFYAGNFIDTQKGKEGALYQKRCGLCLETQYFPDSVNQPMFPTCIFGEGKEYHSVTIYRFGE